MNTSRNIHQIDEIPNLLIDGFRHTIDARPAFYILTHFHSDHYGGLTSTFNRGQILCTPITANLIHRVLGVKKQFIKEVNYNTCVDDLVENLKITFLDANHCPGAAILLFSHSNGINSLHTGDMRYHPRMKMYKELVNVAIDRLYLDTTYAHPRHDFLDQEQAIKIVTSCSVEFLTNEGNGIILLCAYNLGKERLIHAVIDATSKNAYIDENKRKIFECLGAYTASRIEQSQYVTDKTASRFHICKMGIAGSVLPIFRPDFDSLEAYRLDLIQNCNMQVSKLLCIVPTGWVENSKSNLRLESGNVIIQLVPIQSTQTCPN